MTFARTQYRLRIPWDPPARLDLAAIGRQDCHPEDRFQPVVSWGCHKGSRKTNIQENL
ncbi:hypothetical protein ABID19_006618 [Mesorhizobium robiniae]|uniref:Uncharacterized protein n=1 Tax=Mesorhizobium robiniae TaxID=559315 RepID=A0ABV2GZ38_9HYPH